MNGNLKEITIPIVLLIACGVVSLIYSYFLSFTERGLPITDPFNIFINAAWLAVLIWIAKEIFRRKDIEKTLLILALIVSSLTVFDYFDDDVTVTLVILGSLEASLLFLTYYFLVKNKNHLNIN
jgi:hypothetical protein